MVRLAGLAQRPQEKMSPLREGEYGFSQTSGRGVIVRQLDAQRTLRTPSFR